MAPPRDSRAEQHRINDRIRAREVRLIGQDGDQLGIKPVPDALRMAAAADLDLVEVAPMANPPVARIMDYGKFRYEEAQKAKESRKKASNVSIKEVKFKPKIGRGDFETKARKLAEFIREGHKCKVTLQFRGREMAHPELGSKILDQVLEYLGPIAKVDSQARLEGRNMSMVLSPDRKGIADEEAAKLAAAEEASAEEAPDAEDAADTAPTDSPPTADPDSNADSDVDDSDDPTDTPTPEPAPAGTDK